jgi:hypothetical protein
LGYPDTLVEHVKDRYLLGVRMRTDHSLPAENFRQSRSRYS